MSLIGTSRLTAASNSDDAPFWILRHHSPAAITALAFLKERPARTRRRSPRRTTSASSSSSSASEANTSSSDEHSQPSLSSSSAAPRQSTLPEQSRYFLIGDADGKVSLVDLASYRPVAHWQAHKSGTSILGVEDWPYEENEETRGSRGQVRVVTHGRDNTLKIWSLTLPSTSALGKSREAPLAEPRLLHTLQVNALNFCRFSLLPGEVGKGKSRHTGGVGAGESANGMEEWGEEALLAVPHTLDSGYIDIYHLPSYKRLHTSIGSSSSANAQRKVGGVTRAPIVMAMHLFRLRAQQTAAGLGEEGGEAGTTGEESRSEKEPLALLAGYEDGSLVLWTHPGDRDSEVRGQWKESWRAKPHRESVLTLSILHSTSSSRSEVYFLSAGVDDRVVLGSVALCDGSSEGGTAWPAAAAAAASSISAKVLHTYTIPHARGGKAASAFLPMPLPLTSGPQAQQEGKEVRFILGGWDGRGKVYSYTPPALFPFDSTSTSSLPTSTSTSTSVREGEGGGGDGEGIACTRTLRYHKEGVQAVACAALASSPTSAGGGAETGTGGGAGAGRRERDVLIALGGKEGRVTLWRG